MKDKLNSNKPRVSVVTPNYNCKNFLIQAIKSVETQTYENIEHIVIDGASTDGSVEILKSHPTITWLSEPDEGMNDAVNKGFRLSSGDILCYLNSDDFFLENSIELVVSFFNKNPAIDMVIGDYIVCDDYGVTMFTRKVAPLRFIELLFAGGILCQPTVFWRRSVYEKVGQLDITLRFAPDYDYFYRMGKIGAKAGLIRKPLAVFRLRVDSNTIVQHADNQANDKFIYKHWRPFFSNNTINTRLLNFIKIFFRTEHYVRRFLFRGGYFVLISGNRHIKNKYYDK